MNIIEIVGWVGSLIYIVSYFLLTYKIIQKDKLYYLLNKIAAFLIIVISIKKNTFQPIVINSLWLYISYLGYNKLNYEVKFLTKYLMHTISLVLVLMIFVFYFLYNIQVSFEVLAWFSVFAFSSSYFLYSMKKINEKVFHFYNLIAALAIIPKMFLFGNYQVVILEILWALFALKAYVKNTENNNYLTLCS